MTNPGGEPTEDAVPEEVKTKATAKEASRKMKEGADALVERENAKAAEAETGAAEEQPEDKNRFYYDEVAKKSLAEALKPFSPELKDDEREVCASDVGDVYNSIFEVEDPKSVDINKFDDLIKGLKKLGLKREPEGTSEEEKVAGKAVKELFPGLSEEQYTYIVNNLDQMPVREDDAEDPEESEEQKRNLEALGEEGQTVADAASKAITASLEGETDQKKIDKLEGYQKRVTEVRSRLKKFMNPDDPLRTWAIRGGKLGGGILFALFLAIILELHWLHNVGRKQ